MCFVFLFDSSLSRELIVIWLISKRTSEWVGELVYLFTIASSVYAEYYSYCIATSSDVSSVASAAITAVCIIGSNYVRHSLNYI